MNPDAIFSSGRCLISPKIIRDAHLEVKNKSPLKVVSAGAQCAPSWLAPLAPKVLSESLIVKALINFGTGLEKIRHTHILPGIPSPTFILCILVLYILYYKYLGH